MKDHFSEKSDLYKQFRPEFPAGIFSRLASRTNERRRALDCGTGNGQIARQLTGFFDEVYATDISRQQIAQAEKNPSINYSVQAAEKTNFPNHFFNLVIAGQAVHWFDFPAFFKEVDRILKPGGILALIGYHLPRVSPMIDQMIDRYYTRVLGPYWDNERQHIDTFYRDIPFPYPEFSLPPSEIKCTWTFDHFLGYLGTWSALKKYIREKGENPLRRLEPDLAKAWGGDLNKEIRFPVFSRTGQKPF